MHLDGINASSFRHSNSIDCQADADCAATTNESRALVALEHIASASERQAGHRYTPFVAQLLAVKDQHPQTRERRRAEPNEALAAYRATAELTRSH
ncbi:MAG TPA: hypothetical protein VKG24_19630 [Pseudolabrys sp.]|jgi:hypothetical protein|nr:hypothetical protein [Pseudolabrys sp.]